MYAMILLTVIAVPPQVPKPPQAPPVRVIATKSPCGLCTPDDHCGCMLTGVCECIAKPVAPKAVGGMVCEGGVCRIVSSTPSFAPTYTPPVQTYSQPMQTYQQPITYTAPTPQVTYSCSPQGCTPVTTYQQPIRYAAPQPTLTYYRQPAPTYYTPQPVSYYRPVQTYTPTYYGGNCSSGSCGVSYSRGYSYGGNCSSGSCGISRRWR